MKKEEFLKRLRSKQVTPFDMPAIDINPLTFDDVKRKFIETSEAVGGQVIEAAAGDNLNAIIRQAYPNAKRFASNVAGISSDINPDSVAEAADLDGTDVGIVQGALGAADDEGESRVFHRREPCDFALKQGAREQHARGLSPHRDDRLRLRYVYQRSQQDGRHRASAGHGRAGEPFDHDCVD